jgi:capsular polysaccharide biosynthesis protein
VASSLTKQITAKLLSFHFDKIDPYVKTRRNLTIQKNVTKRFIVYLSRSQGARRVYNEIEIIKLIRLHLHDDYELYILGHIDAIGTIKGLHESWARNAAIFSRAKLVLGPHGGAFNHLIWTPPDTHFIEFNLFPDDLNSSLSHGRLPVRSIFLSAFWAKGGSGKFHIVSPSIMHPLDFYAGNIVHLDSIGYGCLFYNFAYYFISFFFEI